MLKNLYDLSKIKEDNYRQIDDQMVEDLAASIAEVGLQEPIKLFEIKETKELYVISGHHRLRAMKKLAEQPEYKNPSFQAFIIQGTTKEYQSRPTFINAVMSNSMRKDLELLDRAHAWQKLRTMGMKASEIARMVNKDKRTVEMTLNVDLLPEKTKQYIRKESRLKDSQIYKVAARYKRESWIDPIEMLQKFLNEKRQGAVAKSSTIRINPPAFKCRLQSESDLSESQVDQVMRLL
ncbi:MAG: hypothetical protein CMP10_20915 [Zetaproteobacteria bacterium]|nr:hypothetical protein [Pseudobdellovibrionaceae bacterium]